MSAYIGYRDGSGTTNEQGLKEELSKLFTAGVSSIHSTTSLAVSQRGAGANMSVDVAVGDCHLVRPDGLYSYWGWTDAVTNVTISASNPSNPRIDVVVAYVDLSVTSGTNNPGALKFTAIAGTPAGSPSAPNSSAIQSALGAGVPWVKLAQVAVAASASNVVNANITDYRQPIAAKVRLWGGSSNTSGHTVPNIADAIVALTSDSGGKVNYAALLSTIFSGQISTYTNTGGGGGTLRYLNLGGIKIAFGITGNALINAGPTAITTSFPASFFTSVYTVVANAANPAAYANQTLNVSTVSTSGFDSYIYGGGSGATAGISFIAIGV